MSNIMIVEDEAIIAFNLSTQLRKNGFLVCGIADNGERAVAMAEEFKPNVILMDIVIKGSIDGIQTAAMIDAAWRPPVIFLSAYSDEETVTRALLTEPYGYMRKPYQMADLCLMIKIAEAKAARLAEYHRLNERYRSVVEFIDYPTLIVNEHNLVVFMSRPMEDLLGISSAEALDLAHSEVLQFVSTTTGQPAANPFLSAIERRTLIDDGGDLALVLRNGEQIPVGIAVSGLTNADGSRNRLISLKLR